MQRETNVELTIGEGSLLLFTVFNTIVGVREPNYGDVCLSLLHAGFQEKQCLMKLHVELVGLGSSSSMESFAF